MSDLEIVKEMYDRFCIPYDIESNDELIWLTIMVTNESRGTKKVDGNHNAYSDMIFKKDGSFDCIDIYNGDD
jgi:hypothetical protein